MSGQPPYAWEPDKGAYVGVMKRNGAASEITWFRAESCYVFHVMNAWEDGNRIIADVMQFEEAPLFTYPDGRRPIRRNPARGCAAGPSISPAIPTASPRPISTISPANSRASTTAAPAWQRPWLVRLRQPRQPMFGALSGIVHVDGKAHAPGRYLLPPGDTISEPVFVARGTMPPRPMAGCSPWSGARGRTAAISRCSTPPMSMPARSRWCIWSSRARRLSRQLGRGGVQSNPDCRDEPGIPRCVIVRKRDDVI